MNTKCPLGTLGSLIDGKFDQNSGSARTLALDPMTMIWHVIRPTVTPNLISELYAGLTMHLLTVFDIKHIYAAHALCLPRTDQLYARVCFVLLLAACKSCRDSANATRFTNKSHTCSVIHAGEGLWQCGWGNVEHVKLVHLD